MKAIRDLIAKMSEFHENKEKDDKGKLDMNEAEEEEQNKEGNKEENKEEEKEFQEVMDSMCMACGGSGTTRYMIHKIPYFRELVISSFECHNEECGECNNEVSFGGEIQLKGCSYTLEVTEPKDLNRQLIKSDSASVLLPGLEFEIPPHTQKGEISTIEGFLMTAAKNLGLLQEERMAQNPEVGQKVADIISQLTRMAMGLQFPFTIVVSDPAGNSFVENLCAPKTDPKLKLSYFQRTDEQNKELGLKPEAQDYRDDSETNFSALINSERGFGGAQEDTAESSTASMVKSEIEKATEDVRLGRQEVVSIPDFCPNCHQQGESLTAMTDIPHFKEVLIMAFTCSQCGYKSSEVKAGGAVPTYGTEVTLRATSPADLKRDVLKSDSAMVKIPELGLELQCGTLGGQYTTVEGLLQKIESSVRDINPFSYGDSTVLHHSEELSKEKKEDVFEGFLKELVDLSAGKRFPFTLTIRDPLGNSFISAHLGSFTPPEADEGLTITDFERTYEENDAFGLNDMNTKDFETGVNYDEKEIHLPDRLTHVSKKQVDHPYPFAQGVADGTQHGMYFPSTADSEKATRSEESSASNKWKSVGPAWGPLDMVKELGCPPAEQDEPTEDAEVVPRRKFHQRDKQLKFKAREEFAGHREGFVFRLGAQGMGYYEDKPQTESEISADAKDESNS